MFHADSTMNTKQTHVNSAGCAIQESKVIILIDIYLDPPSVILLLAYRM